MNRGGSGGRHGDGPKLSLRVGELLLQRHHLSGSDLSGGAHDVELDVSRP